MRYHRRPVLTYPVCSYDEVGNYVNLMIEVVINIRAKMRCEAPTKSHPVDLQCDKRQGGLHRAVRWQTKPPAVASLHGQSADSAVQGADFPVQAADITVWSADSAVQGADSSGSDTDSAILGAESSG